MQCERCQARLTKFYWNGTWHCDIKPQSQCSWETSACAVGQHGTQSIFRDMSYESCELEFFTVFKKQHVDGVVQYSPGQKVCMFITYCHETTDDFTDFTGKDWEFCNVI